MNIDFVKNFVKRHPKLECLYYFISGFDSDSFCQSIIGLKNDPYTIKIHNLGESNPDLIFYYIDFNEGYRFNGFCSIFRFVLLHLAYAEDLRFKPVVRWGEHTLYYDKEIVINKNAFECFFEQISNFSYEDVLNSRHVIFSKGMDASAFGTVKSYDIPDNEILLLGDVCRRYIRLKNDVKDMFWEEMIGFTGGGKTLGVHVRATDFNKGYNRHPKVVTPQEYLDYTNRAFNEYGFEKVFLATDDENVINLFRLKFGDNLVYYNDIYRSKNGDAIHYGNDNVQRKHHKYLLGIEILKDFYTLGHCAGLIAGVSNVSMCARIVKASSGEDFIYKEIIDKGVNHNSRETRSVFKPMVKK